MRFSGHGLKIRHPLGEMQKAVLDLVEKVAAGEVAGLALCILHRDAGTTGAVRAMEVSSFFLDEDQGELQLAARILDTNLAVTD